MTLSYIDPHLNQGYQITVSSNTSNNHHHRLVTMPYPLLAEITCHYVSCKSLIHLPTASFLFPSSTGECTWNPEVFTIIIIIFPYWWLSCNKHSLSSHAYCQWPCMLSPCQWTFWRCGHCQGRRTDSRQWCCRWERWRLPHPWWVWQSFLPHRLSLYRLC